MTEHSKEVMDKRRQGFEAWYSQSWGCDDQLQSLGVFMRDERGQYVYGHVHEPFMAWNAALDSVVIDLPADSTPETFNDESLSNGFNWGVSDCRYAIESTGLGLRVKA